MPNSTSHSGEDFASAQLQKDPTLSYEEVSTLAVESGVPIQPIQFGRALRSLKLTSNIASPAKGALPNNDAGNPEQEEHSNGENNRSLDESVEKSIRKSTPGFQFLVKALGQQPNVSYQALKIRADEQGLKIAPIMYGRAKALLGLVPISPRGKGKNRKHAAEKRIAGAIRSVLENPQEEMAKELTFVREVKDLIKIIKLFDADRQRLRGVLKSIASSIDEALKESDCP
jgi:hypothetical protein